ncbi:MAG TPA: nickel-binding protein [Gaiellaceae bacterium]|nr:nickel-binding protein [Gaiellaceae bacterium]
MEDDHGDVEGAWKTFLVEHYWPGVTAQEFGDAAGRVQASSAELAAGGERIRYLHSTLVPEDEAAFCVFEAATSTLVEEAYRRADVRFERLVPAVETADTTNYRRQG